MRLKKRSNWFLAPTAPSNISSSFGNTTFQSSANATASTSSSSSLHCPGDERRPSSLDGCRASSEIMMDESTDSEVNRSHDQSTGYVNQVAIPSHLGMMVTSTPDNSQIRRQSPLHQRGQHFNDVSSISNNMLSPNLRAVTGSSPSSSSSAGLTPSPCGYPQPSGNHSQIIFASPDYVNGNHHLQQHSTPNNTSQRAPMVTERDVRYFMVENWYGTPTTNNTAVVTPSTGT